MVTTTDALAMDGMEAFLTLTNAITDRIILDILLLLFFYGIINEYIAFFNLIDGLKNLIGV